MGTEERALENYMLLDFEGGATVLLPHRLDQHDDDTEEEGDGFGWVTSLDWTPGKIRYQVVSTSKCMFVVVCLLIWCMSCVMCA